MNTEAAIQTHGATTVYYAAVRATEGDVQALSSVGIDQEDMGTAWRVMSAAHRQMDASDVAQDQVAVAARLANA